MDERLAVGPRCGRQSVEQVPELGGENEPPRPGVHEDVAGAELVACHQPLPGAGIPEQQRELTAQARDQVLPQAGIGGGQRRLRLLMAGEPCNPGDLLEVVDLAVQNAAGALGGRRSRRRRAGPGDVEVAPGAPEAVDPAAP